MGLLSANYMHSINRGLCKCVCSPYLSLQRHTFWIAWVAASASVGSRYSIAIKINKFFKSSGFYISCLFSRLCLTVAKW